MEKDLFHSTLNAQQRLNLLRDMLCHKHSSDNFAQKFIETLQSLKQFYSQQDYEKTLLDLLKDLLKIKDMPTTSFKKKRQFLESHQTFFTVIQNLSRAMLFKAFLPEKTDFKRNLYEFAMNSCVKLYEVILNIQKRQQYVEKNEQACEDNKFEQCSGYGHLLKLPVALKKKQPSENFSQFLPYEQQLKVAYYFFTLVLLSFESLPLLQSLIVKCSSNLYKSNQPLIVQNRIFLKIIERLFDTVRKMEMGFLQKLSQRLQNINFSIQSKAFSTCVLNLTQKLLSKGIPVGKDEYFLFLFQAIEKLILLRKMKFATNPSKQQNIIEFLSSKFFLRDQYVPCIGAIAKCMELFLEDQNKVVQINIQEQKICQSQQNRVFDHLNQLLYFSIDKLPLRSLQIVSFYQKCMIRISARLEEGTLQRRHARIPQSILQQLYRCLSFQSDFILSARCKLRIYQMIETYSRVKDENGFFSKMVNALREKHITFSPQQFLFQSIGAIYSQIDLHLKKNVFDQGQIYINNGQRGFEYLPYMKSLKLSIEQFKCRLEDNNYKFYADRLDVQQFQMIFDDYQKLEAFYSGILLEACSVHLFLSKIPHQLGITDSQKAKNIFLYFYNAVSFFPTPKRIAKNNFPHKKGINLAWLSNNVTRYIAEVITFLIQKNSHVWTVEQDIPFFQNININALIHSFTVEAVATLGNNTQTQNTQQEKYQKDPLALAEPMCTMILFLLKRLYFDVPIENAVKIIEFLRILSQVTKNWIGQNVPYKEPLFSKLCTLAIMIIKRNPLKKAYSGEGVLLVNQQDLRQLIFKMLDGVLNILAFKQTRLQNQKNPQKYVCFLNLLNELTLTFGRKIVKLDQSNLVRQNPAYIGFAQRLLACHDQMLRNGEQSYFQIPQIQKHEYMVLLSDIETQRKVTYQNKFMQNPLQQAESFEFLKNRQVWSKVLQSFRYMMISQMFRKEKTVVRKLTKFLHEYNSQLKICEHLKAQQTIIELLTNKLSQSIKDGDGLQQIRSSEKCLDLLVKQVQIMGQIIQQYFGKNSLHSISKPIDKTTINSKGLNLSLIGLGQSKLKMRNPGINDQIEVLYAIKYIAELLSSFCIICQPRDSQERHDYQNSFNQLSQSLNQLKINLSNTKLRQTRQLNKYDGSKKQYQFLQLKNIIICLINYSRLVIQQKWFPNKNGAKTAEKFNQLLNQISQAQKTTINPIQESGWIGQSPKVEERKAGIQTYVEPSLSKQLYNLRKSYKARFEEFFSTFVLARRNPEQALQVQIRVTH